MVKFGNINFKRLSSIFLSSIILSSICGCSNKKENYFYDNNYHVNETEELKQDDSNDLKEFNDIEESSNSVVRNDFIVNSIVDFSIEDELQEKNKVQDVIDFLETIDDKIMKMGYKTKNELINDYGIVHDFIFEDGTIKGYTFNELKDSIKAKSLNLYLKIDEKIEKHFPQYKETIKEKFGNAKDKVKNKLLQYKNDFIQYFKDEIGEEKYNSFIDTKNKYVEGFKEQTKNDFDELKELGGKAKEKVKSWFYKN